MKRILIVEDDQRLLDFLSQSLRKRGFEILVAPDGLEAIDRLKEFKPDLVILDILLPKLDGLEVLKWIKGNNLDVLVILASAKDQLEDLRKGYSLRADYYITKPYNLEEVLKGINLLFSLKK